MDPSDLPYILSSPATFVDKTMFIKAFLQNDNKFILLTAPSTFGKSTNLNTLRRFLEIQHPSNVYYKEKTDNRRPFVEDDTADNDRLFFANNLKITQHAELMRRHFGQHPVIYVNFHRKPSSVRAFYGAVEFYKRVIRDTIKEHGYLLTSNAMNRTDLEQLKRWNHYPHYGKISDRDVINGLRLLSRCLSEHYGRQKKVVVLIDSFDYPLTAVMFQDAADRRLLGDVAEFSARIFEAIALDRPVTVERMLITATSFTICSRLLQLTAGLTAYRFSESHPFVEYYGLTKSEVDSLFDRRPLFDRLNEAASTAVGVLKNEVRSWCNGYRTTDGDDIYTIEGVAKFFSPPNSLDADYDDGRDRIGAYHRTTKNEGSSTTTDSRPSRRRWLSTPGSSMSSVLEEKLIDVLKVTDVMNKMERLYNDESILVTYRRNSTSNLIILKNLLTNPLITTTNTDYYFTFLLELGYLAQVPPKEAPETTDSIDRIYLKIPNRQVRELFGNYLNNYRRRRQE